MLAGICDICGKFARSLHTCKLCGKRCCERCIIQGVCVACSKGKFGKENLDSKSI